MRDFDWSKEVLAPNVTALDLRGKGLEDVGAAALMGLLHWAANTLKDLDIRSFGCNEEHCCFKPSIDEMKLGEHKH